MIRAVVFDIGGRSPISTHASGATENRYHRSMLLELRSRILWALGATTLAACPRAPVHDEPAVPSAPAIDASAPEPTIDAATPEVAVDTGSEAAVDATPEAAVDAKPKAPPKKPEPPSWGVSFPKANWKEKWCTTNWATCLKAADAKSIATGDAMADKTCPKEVSFPCACSPAHPMGCPMEGQPSPRCEAAFLPAITASERAKTDGGACCYLGEQTCVPPWVGRAFPSVAEPIARSDWRVGASRSRSDLARAAAGEHAAVASFALASLALMAHGAPAELVADTHRAALDEIEHARLLFGLAGEAIGPGPLPIEAKIPSLVEFAVATFRDACVQETLGALAAEADARAEADPTVAAALARIAEDEARHAVLAYRTLAWAVSAGGDAARAAIARELEGLDDTVVTRTLIEPCTRALLGASGGERALHAEERELRLRAEGEQLLDDRGHRVEVEPERVVLERERQRA